MTQHSNATLHKTVFFLNPMSSPHSRIMAIVGDEESQSRSLCCCSSGGGRRGSRAVAGPAVQQGVQGLDDDAHVGTEFTLVLHAQGGHSSHLVYPKKTWASKPRIIKTFGMEFFNDSTLLHCFWSRIKCYVVNFYFHVYMEIRLIP